jgi:rhodanese-related sulfurtransferase
MSSRSTKKSAVKNRSIWLFGLLLVVGIGLIIYALSVISPASPTTTYPLEISVSEAVNKRTAGAFILDVREPSEWQQGHIPGATLVPLGQISSRLSEIPMDQEVVVVCHSGNRSAQARDILLKAGYTTVTSMAGGMTQWQAGGNPIVTGQ